MMASRLGGALCLLTAPFWAGSLQAEEAPAPRLKLDLGSRLSQSSNPDLAVSGGSAARDAALSFGLTAASETRDQSFHLSLGSQVQDGDGLTAPLLNLDYSRKGANAALHVKASYQDADAGTDDALTATGRVRDSDLSLGVQTGIEGPFGADLLAQTHVKDYTETSDTSVYDQTSRTLSAGLSFRGVLGGDIGVDLRQTAADFEDVNQTARDSRSLSLSYDRALDGATKLTASLGQTEAETHKLGALSASSSGLTGTLALQRALGSGTVELGFQTERDANGAQQTLQVARKLTLATGEFYARLGYSARVGGTGQAVGEVTWAQALAADSLNLSLSRQVALNEDEADTLQSALSAAWRHKLGEGMNLGLSYGLNAVAGAGGSAVDGVVRQSLTASYGQDLTRDWALNAGVTLTQIDRDSTGQARDEAVFLSISRSFVLLP